LNSLSFSINLEKLAIYFGLWEKRGQIRSIFEKHIQKGKRHANILKNRSPLFMEFGNA